MKTRGVLRGTVGGLILSLLACDGQMLPDPSSLMPADAYSSSKDPAPEGAEMMSEAEHGAYVGAGNWYVVTKRTAEEV